MTTAAPPQKTIEQKYRKLTDIEHVLMRPGMYVGSTNSREDTVYLLTDGSDPTEVQRFTRSTVTYNPAFLKIFDEILSNSVDEHRRTQGIKLNTVSVTVDPIGQRITIRDNGGIPVVKHTEHDEWVPELIFSNLKAGSNFDDTEQRLVAGTNGVGSTLTNIFSTEFTVTTSDGKQHFTQTFRKNMTERDIPVVRCSLPSEGGYTEISFVPEVSRFGMSCVDETHVEMIRKRCVDIAACNPKLKVSFNGVVYSFSSFQDYCNLYSPIGAASVLYEEGTRWKIGVAPSEGTFTQVSFVNSVETRDGGTYVEYILAQIIAYVRERVRKKHKIDLRPAELRNHFFLFIQADIVNPAFSSQTKEKLITEPKDFGSKYEVSEKLLKAIMASEVVQRILDWAEQKALAEERKQLRELNKNLAKEKVLKLVDAKATAGRNRCSISLFEGDSAMGAVRQFRDPNLQGAFPLRGKFLNVMELPNTKVIQNQEVKDLLTAIGLKMGEDPKDLRYGKILIYADADPDGDSITGLLITFFGKYWPELFARGMIYRVLTPLVVVERDKTRIAFYTQGEFDVWEHAHTKELSKWDIGYKKGLAALVPADFKEIIQNPKMFSLTAGENLKGAITDWFGSDPAVRKRRILGEPDPITDSETEAK